MGVGTGTTAESLARLYPLARSLVPPGGDFRDIGSADLKAIIDSTNIAQANFPTQARTLVTQRGALDVLVGPSAGLNAIKGARIALPKRPADMFDATVVIVGHADGDLDGIGSVIDSGSTAQALRDSGVVPGTGRLAPKTRSGELFAVRDKVSS